MSVSATGLSYSLGIAYASRRRRSRRHNRPIHSTGSTRIEALSCSLANPLYNRDAIRYIKTMHEDDDDGDDDNDDGDMMMMLM